MSTKAKSRGSRRVDLVKDVLADVLADVEPFVLTELQDCGVEVVLRKAGEMSSLLCYRERLEEALRLYVPSDDLPFVVMELNKRILAAADKRRRDAAAMIGTAPRCDPGLAAGKVPMHGMEAVRD